MQLLNVVYVLVLSLNVHIFDALVLASACLCDAEGSDKIWPVIRNLTLWTEI